MTRLLFSLSLLCLTSPAVCLAEEPTSGVWVMDYDSELDGDLKAKGKVEWRVAFKNGRAVGSLASRDADDPKGHQLAGEVADGKTPILTLRQDGPNGLVCFYTGKRAEDGAYVGTWYDNRGGTGDFRFNPPAE